MGKPESDVEQYLHEQIELRGGTTRKWTCPGHAGVPDRVCILPENVIFFVEVKSKYGTLQSNQIREHQRLRDLGCSVFVVEGHSDVNKLMDLIFFGAVCRSGTC